MEKENVDPVYSYVDKKIAQLKKGLSIKKEGQTLDKINNSINELEDRVFRLENKLAPLGDIDVDAFFRQFLILKMNIICVRVCEDMMQRSEAIILPPVSSSMQNSDQLRYNDKKSEKDKLEKAGMDLMGSYAIAKGEIKNTDNPLRVAHDWYAKEKKYFEDMGIKGIFEETADEKFPITFIEDVY